VSGAAMILGIIIALLVLAMVDEPKGVLTPLRRK
jgi:hypothetical protein